MDTNYISQSDSYFFTYREYMAKHENKNKSEIDFIKEKITEYGNANNEYEKQKEECSRINNLPDKELFQHIIEINFQDYNNKKQENILAWFRHLNKAKRRYVCIVSLRYYEMQFSRLEPSQKKEFQNTDLSNSSAVEKIIYLNELGIIDQLRTKQPFSTSINSLATVLSAITDEKAKTLQPYLNAMVNKTNADNKNPYNTEKTVNKVKTQLTNIGFQLK